ncbi:uncharacterized protein [Clytia hemisphaerica]|uniref:Uncharacterized protein n=1 Tax=Clytia hemisphaerica TaxID=252671 RepID=A0A7M5WWP9_9CNID
MSVLEFQSHFKWDFVNLEKKASLYLRDRIKSIDNESFLQNRNLPQNYTLLGFIYSELYRRAEDAGEDLLTNAEDCFQQALNECSDGNTGYLAVIYGNLIYLNEKLKNNDASSFVKEYRKLSHHINLENNAEVLAMKGFTASFFHAHAESINFYQKALTITKTAEWVFGLALVKMRRIRGRTDTIAERKEIEILLRQAMDMDPSYDMIKLKLARLLTGKRYEKEAHEEARTLIDQLKICKNKDKINFMEEMAIMFKNLGEQQRALNMLEKCYRLNPKSPTTLRRLGNMYYEKWKFTRVNDHLQKAIKYFSENVSHDSENALPFDVIKIGKVHLDAVVFYSSQENGNESEVHEQKCKKWFKIAEERLVKEWYDLRNDTETCFELSKFHKYFKNLEKEKQYLKQTLLKANEGSETDHFQELNYFKDAKNRLLVIFKEKNDLIEQSWVYEQSRDYDAAILHLEKQILLLGDEVSGDLLEKEASLKWKFLLSRIKDKQDSEDRNFVLQVNLRNLYQKVEKLHDCAVKWDLENYVRRMEMEILLPGSELNELKEAVIHFGESLLKYRTGKAGFDQSNSSIFRVLHEGKIILDHSVMYIKEKLYSQDGKANFNYPRAVAMQNKDEDGRKDQLEKYYTTNRWKDFSQRCPGIALFLLDRLDVTKYDFLIGFFEVRNAASHKLKSIQVEKLNKYFPSIMEKVDLVYKVSHYVAEVLKFITKEVDRLY